MAYEVLVLDIDGTLTNSDKKITQKTKTAIRRIQENNKIIVLASGRPTEGIMPVVNELDLKKYGGYILSFNGAKIIDCTANEIIYQKTMTKEMAGALYDEAVSRGLGIITYGKHSILSGTFIDPYIETESRINHMEIIRIFDFKKYINFDVNKCLMTGEPSYLAGVEEDLQRKYGNILSIYRSEPFFLEIMPKNIDKASSLERLLKHLHLTNLEMICMGDGFNDCSMIEYAGLGIAMQNAQEAVKKIADYISLSNDEDGVAHVIEKFMI